ncbi:hypothetical protein [Geminocystis herdmanii]|uniref:hypothetical protein n=1 Tax=Geminocystis herdmanii TaxID=669359 RepID=UPI000347D9A3|nr:hypothetical protein [Geminocystis herdmanii]
MTTLIEIETAIKQLNKDQVLQLAQWLDEYLDDNWDNQIKNDFKEGKLDRLIAKAEADIKANNVRNLDEVIYYN